MDKGEIILNGNPEEVFRQVDRMKELGLRVPQVTEFTYRLQKEGVYSSGIKYPVTIDEATDIYKKLLS
jgi:energy-coupling factor transport system ATP-binding protein